MLCYDRIDVSEGIDLAKHNNSKECMICHYWFFNHGFTFQDSACNGIHDLTMLSVNIDVIAIITVKNVDYRCIIHNISKCEAINLLKNYILENRGYILYYISVYSNQFLLLFLFSIYKMVDIMDNISIGTVMKNPEMLTFVSDHLKTKKCVSMQLKNYLIY